VTGAWSGRHHTVGWLLVAAQGVLLAALVLLPGGSAWTVPGWLAGVLLGVRVLGLGICAVGLLHLGSSLTASPVPLPEAELRSDGLYRLVRHPVYTGLLVFAWADAAASGSWAQAGCALALTTLLTGKAVWEERMLAATHPGYVGYTARTGRFLPRLRRS
jgi:protein-S-isoprenylcysteine O-methyltransferase Ste14